MIITTISNKIRNKGYINKRLKNIIRGPRVFISRIMFGENSVSKEEVFTLTSRVGVTKVRHGFSMPP